MEKTVAVIIELSVSVCALWLLFFLSTLFHELGHAVGYMLATGDRQWHIRVGWGKRILNTKRLTVNLLVFDGLFSPSKREFDSKAKLIMTLLGGPVFSLVLVAGLLGLRCSGPVLQSDFFADSAMEFFLNTAPQGYTVFFTPAESPGAYDLFRLIGQRTDNTDFC